MPVALGLVKYGQSNQTLKYDTFESYLHVDNPTNARIVLPNGQSIGPYTLNAVVATPTSQGTFTVDTSDVSYPNVNIFSNAPIVMWLTNEETPNPGLSYAPVANINSTITVSGNVNATVTNTINATITNANLNVTVSNASIAVAQSGAWNVGINGNVTIGNILAGTVTFSNSQINVQNVPATLLGVNLPQVNLGNFTVLPAGGSNTATYSIPTGTHAIGIFVVPITVGEGLDILNVQGITTGVNGLYLSLSGSPATTVLSGYFVSPVLSVLDTQVKISATTDAATTHNVTVYAVAILDAEGVFIFNNAREPAAVTLKDSLNNTVGIGNNPIIIGTSLNAAGVGQQGTWTMSSVSVPATSGTNTVLVAANANRRGLLILCDHNTGTIYINAGATNANAIARIPPTGYWEMPLPAYTGQITFSTTTTSQGGAIHAVEIT